MARGDTCSQTWLSGSSIVKRRRLDLLLVEQGLLPSQKAAQAAVLAGEVRVDGKRADKPGVLLPAGVTVAVVPRRPRYVSRGGEKLEHALRTFGIPVSGRVALDVGASTGGFTDCLLQHGARSVYAVDVGKGQLHWRLRQDPRVHLRERTHAARLDAAALPEPVDLAAVDVSFISLRRVLPGVAASVRPGGSIVALVKPQFEAARAEVPKGVVRSPEVHRHVLARIAGWIASQGWTLAGMTPSPLVGPKGNLEFFFWVVKGLHPAVDDVDGAVAAVVREAAPVAGINRL